MSVVNEPSPSLPYVSVIMDLLQEGHPRFSAAFGRHIHWGYWPDPSRASRTDDDFATATGAMSRRVCDVAEIGDGLSILDVGCGVGGVVSDINERFSGVRLVGLNIDRRQVEWASQRILPLTGNSIRFVQGDACRLDFEDGEFDRVLAVECIFHFPSRDRFFAEAGRVLKPGGVLAVSDFVPVAPLAAPLKLLDRLFTSEQMIEIYGKADTFCSLPAYRQLATRHGFVLATDEDITRNTLPSYPYVCDLLLELTRRPQADEAFKASTSLVAKSLRRFETLARSGAMRYRILAFRR